MRTVNLGGVLVGPGQPPYVIAEVGANHNGDLDLCRRLVDAAADCGAHAVKFQSWTDTSLIAQEEYRRNVEYADTKRHFGSLEDMVRAYQFTPDQHRLAKQRCAERGIAFCSTPFSSAEVDLLVDLDVPFLKIASMDIVNLPLIDDAARRGRPLLLSTGMASLAEIERAVETARAAGNEDLVLLHCISIYPPEYETIHLRNLATFAQAFAVPVGFSDHTMGTAIPLAAVALGACVIEKHFTLDKDLPGWDHAISADPAELRTIVQEGAHVFAALGDTRRRVSAAELAKRAKFRRSLVARAALPQGHVLTSADLDAKRPGTGIAPDERAYVIGRALARDVAADQVLAWEDLR